MSTSFFTASFSTSLSHRISFLLDLSAFFSRFERFIPTLSRIDPAALGKKKIATPHHFDCTFHSEWMRWGGKQTIRFISVGLVSVMNSFCCTFSASDIGKWLLTCVPSSGLFLSSPSPISPFHSKYPRRFSSAAPAPSPSIIILYMSVISTYLTPLTLSMPSSVSPSAGTDLFSNCTEECKALGHSDRCWMPSFMPSDGRQGPDYRSNLHVPGMDATLPDTEVPSSVNLSDQLTMTSPTASSNDRSFSTFGKDGQRSQSHHSLHHHLHQQQQQYSSSTLERKEYDRGTLPYKPTFLCEYQYESSLGPYDFGLVQYRYWRREQLWFWSGLFMLFINFYFLYF